MPVVRASNNLSASRLRVVLSETRVTCREVVPAALNVPSAPLFPGSIYFFDNGEADMPVDMFLDIEAMPNDERDAVEASQHIQEALHVLLPEVTFAICIKLCQDAWLSDRPQPKPKDVDMSILSATERARSQLEELRSIKVWLGNDPMCYSCGIYMVRAGSVFVCGSCGATNEPSG